MKRLVLLLIFGSVVSFGLLSAVGASGGGARSAVAIPAFTTAQVNAPAGANYISENANLSSWRYSTLSQINATNGSTLKLAWTTHLADPAHAQRTGTAATMPLAYNGVVYTQDQWFRITAIAGDTGKILWQFNPDIALNTPGGGNARTIGMGDNMIFTAAHGTVYAINAQTGAQVWATQVQDPIGGANIDSSPLYYKGMVVLGTAGGDSGAACIAVALDAKTGKVKWHFSNIPSTPKAPGWNTWPSTRWYFGGGAIWDPVTISSKLDMVYFGTGQALPFNGLMLGTGALTGVNGVYGLHVLTGKFAWWFQEVHHDIWDYDSQNTPLLMTINYQGKQVDVISHTNKDAYNYVLNAATGKPVIPVHETPVPQEPRSHTYPTQPIPEGDALTWRVAPDPENWNGILAPDGKPFFVAKEMFTPYTDQQYVVVGPGTGGGIEWPEAGYDPTTKTIIACVNNLTQAQESPPAADQHPVVRSVGFGNVTQLRTNTAPNAMSVARLVAFSPETNKIIWKHDELSTGGLARGNASACSSAVNPMGSGISLIGRIVPSSENATGMAAIQAFSSTTGDKVWEIPVRVAGQAVPTVPRITPYSVNGKEYIVSATNLATVGPDVSAYTLP